MEQQGHVHHVARTHCGGLQGRSFSAAWKESARVALKLLRKLCAKEIDEVGDRWREQGEEELPERFPTARSCKLGRGRLAPSCCSRIGRGQSGPEPGAPGAARRKAPVSSNVGRSRERAVVAKLVACACALRQRRRARPWLGRPGLHSRRMQRAPAPGHRASPPAMQRAFRRPVEPEACESVNSCPHASPGVDRRMRQEICKPAFSICNYFKVQPRAV